MLKRTIHIGSSCRLFTKNKQLVIQYNHIKGQEDMLDKSVPIEDIAYLILEHPRISLSHPLLNEFLKNNIAFITCNETLHPTGLMLNLDGNDTQSEKFRAQIKASEPLKKNLWQQTIESKIQNQARVLAYWNIENKYLLACSKQVRSGDSDNREATASYYYWQHLFPPAWKFYRKRDGAPPNNLLNYGYAILRAVVARSLVGSGLLPTLGIFHRNRYNAYCLADDIMEPYRPYVDYIVRKIIDRTSHISELNKEFKAELLAIPAMDVYIDNKMRPLMIAVQQSTSSLSRCFLGEGRQIIYPTFHYAPTL